MKNNLNVFSYGYLPGKYVRNWIPNLLQFFRNCKYAWQRATKGYCNYDVWGLYEYYTELFYVSLRELADTTHGYPGVEIFSDEQSQKDGFVDGFDRWQKYLYEMAEHFLNTQEWNEGIPINQERDALWEKMNSYVSHSRFEPCKDNEVLYELIETYADKKAYETAREEWLQKEQEAYAFRKKEMFVAFDMMKEWFFHLWD